MGNTVEMDTHVEYGNLRYIYVEDVVSLSGINIILASDTCPEICG